MLKEFADGGTLSAAPGFGATFQGGDQVGKVLADVGGAGAVEIELASQFIGQQGEIKRLAVGQAVGREIMGGGGPSADKCCPVKIN